MSCKPLRLPLAAMLLLVLAAPFGWTQNRTNFAWWNSPLRENLGLTPAQNQKIRQIVRSHRDRLLDARNEVQKAEGDLEDLFNDPAVNPQTAQPVIERLATARANANRVLLEMSVQLRSVLSYEQWRQLVRLADQAQRRSGGDTQTRP